MAWVLRGVGVAWRSVVWCGVVWRGVVWCGVVRCVVWYGVRHKSTNLRTGIIPNWFGRVQPRKVLIERFVPPVFRGWHPAISVLSRFSPTPLPQPKKRKKKSGWGGEGQSFLLAERADRGPNVWIDATV